MSATGMLILQDYWQLFITEIEQLDKKNQGDKTLPGDKKAEQDGKIVEEYETLKNKAKEMALVGQSMVSIENYRAKSKTLSNFEWDFFNPGHTLKINSPKVFAFAEIYYLHLCRFANVYSKDPQLNSYLIREKQNALTLTRPIKLKKLLEDYRSSNNMEKRDYDSLLRPELKPFLKLSKLDDKKEKRDSKDMGATGKTETKNLEFEPDDDTVFLDDINGRRVRNIEIELEGTLLGILWPKVLFDNLNDVCIQNFGLDINKLQLVRRNEDDLSYISDLTLEALRIKEELNRLKDGPEELRSEMSRFIMMLNDKQHELDTVEKSTMSRVIKGLEEKINRDRAAFHASRFPRTVNGATTPGSGGAQLPQRPRTPGLNNGQTTIVTSEGTNRAVAGNTGTNGQAVRVAVPVTASATIQSPQVANVVKSNNTSPPRVPAHLNTTLLAHSNAGLVTSPALASMSGPSPNLAINPTLPLSAVENGLGQPSPSPNIPSASPLHEAQLAQSQARAELRSVTDLLNLAKEALSQWPETEKREYLAFLEKENGNFPILRDSIDKFHQELSQIDLSAFKDNPLGVDLKAVLEKPDISTLETALNKWKGLISSNVAIYLQAQKDQINSLSRRINLIKKIANLYNLMIIHDQRLHEMRRNLRLPPDKCNAYFHLVLDIKDEILDLLRSDGNGLLQLPKENAERFSSIANRLGGYYDEMAKLFKEYFALKELSPDCFNRTHYAPKFRFGKQDQLYLIHFSPVAKSITTRPDVIVLRVPVAPFVVKNSSSTSVQEANGGAENGAIIGNATNGAVNAGRTANAGGLRSLTIDTGGSQGGPNQGLQLVGEQTAVKPVTFRAPGSGHASGPGVNAGTLNGGPGIGLAPKDATKDPKAQQASSPGSAESPSFMGSILVGVSSLWGGSGSRR